MKIKYLKEMHNANVGEMLEVTDFEANILIKTGVAELVESQSYEYLQNLNGTPIADDFGGLVLASNNDDSVEKITEQAVAVKPKATRTRKAK